MLIPTPPAHSYLPPAGTSSSLPRDRCATRLEPDDAPVVAAVDASATGAEAARTAIAAAGRLAAAKRALGAALAAAEGAGVTASGEELDGSPARRLLEFAHLRGARLVVLGSRRRRFGRSVSRSVIRAADRPVLVAGAPANPIA
jgi:nucleotide-binding universal stress UspA family protein